MDNYIRWNSWDIMLIVALKHQSAIDSYIKKYYEDLGKDYLSPEDWKKLRTIEEFLQPFRRATLATQGNKATLDKVLFNIDILRKVYEKSIVSNLLLYLNRF